MDNEQYNFVLGSLSSIEKKIDLIIDLLHMQEDIEKDEFEEEFDL